MGITLSTTRKTWHHLTSLSPYPWKLGSFEWITQLIDVNSSPYFIETPEPPLRSRSLEVHRIPWQSHFPDVLFNTLDCTPSFPLEIKGKNQLVYQSFVLAEFYLQLLPMSFRLSVGGLRFPNIPQQAGSTAAAELQMCSCWAWLAASTGEQRGLDWEGIFLLGVMKVENGYYECKRQT